MTRSTTGEQIIPESTEGDDFVPLPLATDLPPGTVVGEYTIDCKLGDGGMATVYGATHPLIGKKAAIKVMNPALSLDLGLVERFVLEAQAVNHIRHPNIVDVFSFGQLPDGRSYFVMEWLPGETLYARLWERKLTLDEALDILDQMCDALEAAHEAGIVHRDLKPANVFLTPRRGKREQVKLLDFGVAKLTRPRDDEPMSLSGPQTQVGQVVGTPEYIAPEQARGKAVDGKCDVYAMGIISYEMILGQRPFAADNTADLVRMHLTDKPPIPRTLWPEVPSSLNDLLLAMLEKQAVDRPLPREVRAVIRELRGTPVPFDFNDSMPGFTPPPSALKTPSPAALPAVTRPPRSRRPFALALAGVVLGVLAAVAWRAQSRVTHVIAAPVAAPLPAPSPAASPTAPVPELKPSLPTPTAEPQGTLVVRVDAPDASIELDGELIALAASGARVKVTRGQHQLNVAAPGRKPYSSKVAVAEGAAVEVLVHLHGKDRPRGAGPAASKPAETTPTPNKRHDPDYLVDPFSSAK
jgi:serine/threonine-protein kinase